MSWLAVARKDFRDAVRSRSLWALGVVYVLLSLALSYTYAEFPAAFGGAATTPEGLIFFTAATVSLFISLTAIVVCYKSLAGERELGSIKLLLSLPHSRRDVVLGKLLGRTGVMAIPVVAGLTLGTALGWALMGATAPVAFVLFLLVAVLFTFTYVSVVVGLSALTGSTGRASAMAVGFFVVFEILWDAAPIALVWVVNGFSLPARMPEWVYLVNQVPPSAAFMTALSAVLPAAPAAAQGAGQAAQLDAFYATPWVGVVALVAWIVVPVAVGYRRFERADL